MLRTSFPGLTLAILLAVSAISLSAGSAAHAQVSENLTICESGDCERQLAELERLARKGSGDAAAVVALAYASGDGVEQDTEKAQQFMEQGANRRNPLAMYVISDWYQRGFVVEQNAEQSQRWLDRAVKTGYAPALYLKATQLLASNTVTEQQQAVPLLEQAAETGLLTAMYALARLQQTGTLVEQDLIAAGTLFARLARSGYGDARQQLQQVNQQLAGTEFAASDDGQLLRQAEQAMERITVTADASLYRSQLDRLVNQLDASGSFDNRSIGSRIRGVGCADTGSPCAVLSPGRGQSSLGDVLSGNRGGN
ncbi:sel1 repeat family protein [Pseudidiomarina sp. 1APP75-32.1]|uniref:Sel1 repeat family protein n=1 Tax=Pseudidiomarina terrestris TaxID=2820060 RepID=A0AAW7R3V3_9GAMM|nr:tetratricopeptide repeat protein [Pseudidiomarina sp. 1APP75-32.1]MDN7125179.1 sel1 repeat family protein [Pseudidiomarina sp. 1APP75-32.1]